MVDVGSAARIRLDGETEEPEMIILSSCWNVAQRSYLHRSEDSIRSKVRVSILGPNKISYGSGPATALCVSWRSAGSRGRIFMSRNLFPHVKHTKDSIRHAVCAVM